MDADDFLFPNSLPYLMENLRKTETDCFVFSTLLSHDGIECLPRRTYIQHNTVSISKFARMKPLKGEVWQYVFRRNLIIENNVKFPVGVRISEDQAFTYSILSKLDKITILPRPVYVYFLGNANNSSSRHNIVTDTTSHICAIETMIYHYNNCPSDNRFFLAERIAMMIFYINNLIDLANIHEIKLLEQEFHKRIPFRLQWIFCNKAPFVFAAFINFRLARQLRRMIKIFNR